MLLRRIDTAGVLLKALCPDGFFSAYFCAAEASSSDQVSVPMGAVFRAVAIAELSYKSVAKSRESP